MTDQLLPEECAPGIWRVALPMNNGFLPAVNAYLAEDDHGVTLIDSGLANEQTWEVLTLALETLRIPLKHVNRILLTHAHSDHAGLAGRIADQSGATVWIHQRDLEFFNRRVVHVEQFKQELRRWFYTHGAPDDEASELAFSIEGAARQARQLPDGEAYREGERIHLGSYDFDVTWTPGHTPGHVCFMDADHALLICGDHVLPTVSPNVGVQPDTDVNPMPGYLASLEALSESDIQTTLPGHGDRFEIQSRARDLLTHQLGRQQRLLELLSEYGAITAYELGEIVWANTRPQSWTAFRPVLRRNAINTLIAHLELLRAQDRVERTDELPFRYELSS